jgi:hypothetical protein
MGEQRKLSGPSNTFTFNLYSTYGNLTARKALMCFSRLARRPGCQMQLLGACFWIYLSQGFKSQN